MAEVLLVLGISGVGKSTVIEKALEKLPEKPAWYNFGDLMLEILKSEGKSIDRDKMKELPISEIKRLQKLVAEKLNKMPGIVIVDTHLALESPYGFIPGITREFLEDTHIRHITIIEAPPEEILKRRMKDEEKRERFPQTEEDIGTQLMMDRSMAGSISIQLGIPVKIIQNIKLEKASDELADTWRRIMWR